MKKMMKGFTLVELMIVVAILAILSVVAVPAFITYMRKAKTTEAIDGLDKVVKGAAEYIMEPRVNKTTWKKLPCQFPIPTTAPYPVGTSCCDTTLDTDNDGRCDGQPTGWDASPTWSALKFKMDGAHYFQFHFLSGGTGVSTTDVKGGAWFEAYAYGNLDCDTIMSTFIRFGRATIANTVQAGTDATECSYNQASAPYVENETE